MGEHNELKNRTLHILWESAGQQTYETVNETVNETTQAVLALIAKKPRVTYEELTQAVGKSRATVHRSVRALKDAGMLVRVGSDKTGFWKIATD